jgi:lipopolysaccharide transport system permease protein
LGGMIETIYEPDNSLKKGYLSIFKEIFEELRQNRWLTYQLFKRDLLSMYKQSFVGILWAIILPLASVGTFITLNSSGVFSINDTHAPYAIYAMLGMAFWQLFSTSLVAGSNSLVSAGSMILKINFSKKSLVIGSTGKSVVSFFVQIILVGILFTWYGIAPSFAAFLIPVLVIPLMLLTLGLGFIMSILNGIVRDIGNIILVLLTFLMFLTPILYAKPRTGILAKVTTYNPLYYLISVPRDLVLSGTIHEWEGFAVASLLSVLVFLVCLIAFHLTETRIAERI